MSERRAVVIEGDDLDLLASVLAEVLSGAGWRVVVPPFALDEDEERVVRALARKLLAAGS